MSKDLVRKIDVSKPEPTDVSKPERTEVDEATHALAERMLFGTEPRPQPVQGRRSYYSRARLHDLNGRVHRG